MSSQNLDEQVGSEQVGPLYRKLVPRPNGPRRAVVIRNQVARIGGATLEAMAYGGYRETRVAALCRLAGVSKRTFYEHFENKEACFLEMYEMIVRRVIDKVEAAYRSQESWLDGMQCAFDAFAGEAVGNPKSTALAAVGITELGPLGRLYRRRTAMRFERMIDSSVLAAAEEMKLPGVAVRAMVGVAEWLTFEHLCTDRELDLQESLREALAWVVNCYGMTGEVPVTSVAPPGTLPGRPDWGIGVQRDSERSRMLDAAVEIVMAGGYEVLSESEICDRAGLWRDEVYKCFGDAEACFREAVEVLGAEALRSTMYARRDKTSWPEAVRYALRGLLDHCVRDDAFREVVFVEGYGAGPAGAEATMRFGRHLVSVLLEGAPRRLRCSEEADWLAAGILRVLSHQLQVAKPEGLRSVGNQLTYLVVAPFMGSKAAVAVLAS